MAIPFKKKDRMLCYNALTAFILCSVTLTCHLYLQVYHLLVQCRFCPFDLLDPLEGDKQQDNKALG